MAIYSSVLAWRIPGTGEPGRLQSMESQSRTRLKQLSSSSSSMDTLSLTKEARIYNGLKTISLTSGAGKTGQPLVKE